MSPPSRRQFLRRAGLLASVSALASATGCSTPSRNDSQEDPTDRPADSPIASTSPPTGPSEGSTDSPTDGSPQTDRSTPESVDFPPFDGSWNSYRGDVANTASTEDPGPPGSPTEVWRSVVSTGPPATAPAAADGAFYVVMASGALHALAAEDGSIRWATSRTVSTDVDPVAGDQTVVVADGDTLVGFATDTGNQQWTVSLAGMPIGLAVAGGQVVAATERELIAVSFGEGAVQWRHTVEGSVTTRPDLGEVVAAGLASGAVLALDPTTGASLWRQSVGDIAHAPAVAGGQVYVQAGDRLVALATADGEQVWSVTPRYGIDAPPVATPDGVYTLGFTTDADRPTETTETPTGPTETPMPADTEWYRAGVLALAPDGSERWEAELRDTYNFTSGPPERLSIVATDDRVYVQIASDLTALDAAAGERAWEAPVYARSPTVTDGVVSTGGTGRSVAAGTEKWEFSPRGGVGSAPSVAGNTVYVGSRDSHLYALAANSGDLRWRARTGGTVRTTPAVGENAVYVGSIRGSLYAFAKDDGSQLWEFETGGQPQSPTLADGTLYFGTFGPVLHAVSAADGTVTWRHDLGKDRIVGVPAVADGTVYCGDNGVLAAVDAADGTEQWRFEYGTVEVIQSTPTVAAGRVFANIDRSLYAFDASDGTELWSVDVAASNSPPAVKDGTVYTPTTSGISAVDAADATEQWQTAVGRNPWVATGDDTVYAGKYDTPVTALDPADGSQRWSHPVQASKVPGIAGEYLVAGEAGDQGQLHALGPPPE